MYEQISLHVAKAVRNNAVMINLCCSVISGSSYMDLWKYQQGMQVNNIKINKMFEYEYSDIPVFAHANTSSDKNGTEYTYAVVLKLSRHRRSSI